MVSHLEIRLCCSSCGGETFCDDYVSDDGYSIPRSSTWFSVGVVEFDIGFGVGC